MTKQIHGHEVIEMMLAANQSYSRESLQEAIVGQFGPAARFHTCSADNMDAAGLIEFLAQHGKFTVSAAGFSINPAKVCSH